MLSSVMGEFVVDGTPPCLHGGGGGGGQVVLREMIKCRKSFNV